MSDAPMTFRHDFDPTVLREYDIRGIVGKTLHESDAFAIGRCFGTIVAREGGTSLAVAIAMTVPVDADSTAHLVDNLLRERHDRARPGGRGVADGVRDAQTRRACPNRRLRKRSCWFRDFTPSWRGCRSSPSRRNRPIISPWAR